MPREQINYPGTPNDAGTTAHVVWNPHVGIVQLAFAIPEENVRAWLDNPERMTDADGTIWFYTDELGRPSVNKLIRTARNARDKAYGRDE